MFCLIFPSLARAVTVEDIYQNSALAATQNDSAEGLRTFSEQFESFKKTNEYEALKSQPDGPAALAVAERVSRLSKIKQQLDGCRVSNGSNSSDIASLLNVISQVSRQSPDCVLQNGTRGEQGLGAQSSKNFSRLTLKTLIVAQAKYNLQKTKKYWDDVSAKDPVGIATELTFRQKTLKTNPVRQGVELLFLTTPLKKHTMGTIVRTDEVERGLQEIKTSVENQTAQLGKFTFEELIQYQPGAVAEILLQYPEQSHLLCKYFEGLEQKRKNKEFFDNAYLLGSVIIGGAMIVSGVGALPGTIVLGAAATISVVDETGRGYKAYNDISLWRDSVLSGSQNADKISQVDEKRIEVVGHGVGAALSAFGMGSTAGAVRALRATRTTAEVAELTNVMTKTNQSSKLKEFFNSGGANALSPEESSVLLREISSSRVSASQKKQAMEILESDPTGYRQRIKEVLGEACFK